MSSESEVARMVDPRCERDRCLGESPKDSVSTRIQDIPRRNDPEDRVMLTGTFALCHALVSICSKCFHRSLWPILSKRQSVANIEPSSNNSNSNSNNNSRNRVPPPPSPVALPFHSRLRPSTIGLQSSRSNHPEASTAMTHRHDLQFMDGHTSTRRPRRRC